MSNVIIIGGGAAGMMAAITAARNNNKVTLIERMKSLERSFLLQEKADVILPMPGMKKIYLTA